MKQLHSISQGAFWRKCLAYVKHMLSMSWTGSYPVGIVPVSARSNASFSGRFRDAFETLTRVSHVFCKSRVSPVMLRGLAGILMLFTIGVGNAWGTPTVLFHEAFGSVSSATNWNYATHSTKSGVASVFSGVSSYSITNADKICKYNMGYGTTQNKDNTDGSALYSNQGQTGTLIIGPLNVSDYESLNVTHWVGKSSGGAWDGTNNIMTLKYSTNNSTYTAVSQTGSLPSGAVGNTAVNHNYTQVSYSLPAAAISNTLYLKFEFYVYQRNKKNEEIGQCYIDEVELTGTAAAVTTYTVINADKGLVGLADGCKLLIVNQFV